MCQIIDVVPYKRLYKLPDSKTLTDKALLVSIGPSQIVKKMDILSNSRITQEELDHYLLSLRQAMATLPPHQQKKYAPLTKKVRGVCVCLCLCTVMGAAQDVQHLRVQQLKALRHTYTHQEIQQMIEKRVGHNKFLTTDYTTARERLAAKYVALSLPPWVVRRV